MQFTEASGMGWVVLSGTGDLGYIRGVTIRNLEQLQNFAQASAEMLAEVNRQIEAAKPKPGDFKPGDRIECRDTPGLHRGKVVKVNGRRGVIFDEGTYSDEVIIENEGWIPTLYVKITE